MRTPGRTVVALVGAVLAAALLAGCSSSGPGSDDKSAAAIKSSLTAARTAKTLRLAGTGRDSGKPIQLDIHYGSNGSDGSITYEGFKIKLILTSAFVYFKAPDGFWRKEAGKDAAAVLRVVHGKWVKVKATSGEGKSFGELADRKKIIGSFTDSLDPGGTSGVTRIGSATVAGIKTITYGDAADSGKSKRATIDVAATGTPYPIKIVDPSTSDGGTLVFTQWNKPYTVKAPKRSNTVTFPS